ncbi:MAG TPA: hypothetical protein VGV17_02950 [Bosea sp. (in: a-proteobacteria)]|jgi:hypothetical protein|uniref:hypothetical protein n=1 Tax=Bosea sp. (in: a-proteobacteria) TaxID=1871050 RepID=UPI002DDD8E8A|nr:hypothetical protein [Bosea sp. (in: a-proteobacteria)]HEV2552703.1 hypothetical protein [Bosea sp. (in: a-proteobacteria)]
MTQLKPKIGHPATRERISAKAVETALAVTLAAVQVVWLGLMGYGAWWLVFC